MRVAGRRTRQKEAIRRAFALAGRPLSHEEALALAQSEVDGLSVATMYRNVRQLVEEKWLNAVEVPGAPARYELAGKGHHHHFHCNGCGRMFDLPGCAMEVQPLLPEGFRSTGHEFFAYGLCPGCGPGLESGNTKLG